jgi:hypothetical protein
MPKCRMARSRAIAAESFVFQRPGKYPVPSTYRYAAGARCHDGCGGAVVVATFPRRRIVQSLARDKT